MKYSIIIQENLDNGSIYMRAFPLNPCSVHEALRFRGLSYHSDCIFIPEYCLN